MASSGATLRGVDALREVTPPFSPEQVVEQFSSLLRSCNCDKVVGDRYAGEWRFYNGTPVGDPIPAHPPEPSMLLDAPPPELNYKVPFWTRFRSRY